jgi:hypothetical protein
MSKIITLNRFGILALLGAVTSVALGFAIYRQEMGPHIFGELAAILLEAALVVFVLDRLTQRQKQREWTFVRKVVGQRMAACMVDILRLCSVRWSSSAYSSNVSRYGEFLHLAQMHFADLRSSIEGLALGAEPSDYEKARKIELRIGWLIDKLGAKPEFPQEPPQEVHSIVLDTHVKIHEFLVAESGFHKISKIVAEIDPSILDKTLIDDMNNFFSRRIAAQNELLKLQERSGSPVQGIWFDVDQELALGYFAIDSILLGGRDGHFLSPQDKVKKPAVLKK